MTDSKISLFERLRYLFSRSRLSAKFFGIPSRRNDKAENGVILIQIDALSRSQMEHAIKKERLPFLASLIERQAYETNDFYSGIPSSTPAVQAEIFYGVKCAVPAFKFYNRDEKRTFAMWEAESASYIADNMEHKSEGLMKGGSAYSNIYTGSAENSRVCAERTTLSGALSEVKPFKVFAVALLHITKILRVLGLALAECLLAAYDLVKGVLKGEPFNKEITFVAARVGVSIVLREMVLFWVKSDIYRGLPIIQANFIGYDEQAHRRGPDSRFAHWCLKGIDRSIKEIFRTANSARTRNYKIIIHSDHGQIKTIPYSRVAGKPIEETAKDAFADTQADYNASPFDYQTRKPYSLRRHKKQENPIIKLSDSEKITVAASGPIAHIYLPCSLKSEDMTFYAQQIIEHCKAPLVLFKNNQGRHMAVTEDACLPLDEAADFILGSDHRFKDEALADMAYLTEHVNAGDFILLGWAFGKEAVSFAEENGAHGGIHPEETHGFLLTPINSSTATDSNKAFARPVDLRNLVLRSLGKLNQHEQKSKVYSHICA